MQNHRTSICRCISSVGLIAGLSSNATVWAAGDADAAAELAKNALNPVAAMISVPLQYNYDQKLGPDEKGSKHVLNIQPVIPMSISSDWNLISRTIVPLVDQHNVPTDGVDKSGVGDVLQSFFFSPKEPTASGTIWGIGPAFGLRTASDSTLGSGKWSAGPTAVMLNQGNGWTYGVLANHLWSFAGDSQRDDLSVTFIQPFLSYTFPGFTTLGINAESTYNWKADQWSVPINLTVTQLLKIGGQPLTLAAGVRYWAESPTGGPQGVGARLALTFLFPK